MFGDKSFTFLVSEIKTGLEGSDDPPPLAFPSP